MLIRTRGGDAAETLIGLGLTTGLVKRQLAEQFARIQALRNAAG